MTGEIEPAKVLEFSNYINDKLGIKHDISSYGDIDIGFFEAIFNCISKDNVPSKQSTWERFRYIIQWLSDCLCVPLDHINAKSLEHSDPIHLYNLLEILDLCIDAIRFPDGNPNRYEDTERSQVDEQVIDDIDEALKKSRLNYLSCKLAEMISSQDDENNLLPPELNSNTRPKRFNIPPLRVKFADAPHIITSRSVEPPSSSRSTLYAVRRPLQRNSNKKPSLSLFEEIKEHFRWYDNMQLSKLLNRDLSLHELLERLEVLQLPKETRNYIKLKIESYLRPLRSAVSSVTSYGRDGCERRLAEAAERQRRRVELMERQAEDAERMRSLWDFKALQRLLAAELSHRRRQEVLSRNLCLRRDERLRALIAARMAQEEQIVRSTFNAAIERARRDRIEENTLRREVRQKEVDLQNTLISNLENRHEERLRILQEERNKLQAEIDLETKSNKMDSLRTKLELRNQLVQQIKELEEALFNELKPEDLEECDGTG